MQKSKKNTYALFIIIIAVLVIILFTQKIFGGKNLGGYTNLNEFSKCLATQNIVMYGNWWCGACENQKKLFGKYFKNVKYVECTKNTSECINKNIEYTPTWIFPNGEKLIGLTSLEILSEKSNCELKNKK